MATVYLQPGTGTGTGTASDPYYYSQLASAETAAGNGGTILFTDGTYNFSVTNQTWDAGGLSDMTYKSENHNGASLVGSSVTVNPVSLTIGHASNSTIKVEGFKCDGIIYNLTGTTVMTLSKLKHHDTQTTIAGYKLGINSTSNASKILDCSFSFYFSTAGRIFSQGTSAVVERTSFNIMCSSVSSGGITCGQPSPDVKNTIYYSDNSTAIADGAADAANSTNSCFFNMHTNDMSGGTDNIFQDPQFVDATTGDLRLRPSSPCINAGTAS
jgi:hypothetical protein